MCWLYTRSNIHYGNFAETLTNITKKHLRFFYHKHIIKANALKYTIIPYLKCTVSSFWGYKKDLFSSVPCDQKKWQLLYKACSFATNTWKYRPRPIRKRGILIWKSDLRHLIIRSFRFYDQYTYYDFSLVIPKICVFTNLSEVGLYDFFLKDNIFNYQY